MFVKTSPKRLGFTLIISLLLLVPFRVLAQNEVAIGSAVTKSNAILWLNGNGSQGLLLPVVTNKSAVVNPEKGMFVYDDSDDKVWLRNETGWVEAGSGGSGGGTVTSVTGIGPVAVANPSTTPTISISDGGIATLQLANNAVTSAKILDATITAADLLNSSITVDKLAQSSALVGQVLKWNGTNWVPQNDDAGAVPTLNNGQLLVGDGTTNSAVAVSGDATLSGGVLTITNGVISGGKIANATITNANIANVAGIEVTKLANGANGQVLTTISGIPTWSAGSTGTVTSVAAGTGLTGGPITSTGTLSVDVGATANKIVQLDGTARLPAVDGSQLINLNASSISVGILPLDRITPGTAGDVLTTVAGVPTWQAPAASADAQDLTLAGTTLSLVNDPTPVVLGGLSILNGITTAEIVNDAIINADISPLAAISVTKVAAGVDGQVLTTTGGVPTWLAPAASPDAQDLTLAGTTLSLVNDPTPVVLGGLSVLNSVTTAEITNATIIAADLAAGSVSGGVGGIISDATITTDDIANLTVTNADISGSAAIAVTKVAAGANGDVLTTVLGVPTWQAPVTGATTLDGLTDATVSAPASGQLLVNNGAGQFVNVAMSGDATISNTGVLTISNGAISGGVGGKITDATIAAADLATSSVSGGAGGIIADGTITTADILDGTVASADITDGTVTNTDISLAAAIAVTKVAAGTNGQVLTTVGTTPTWAAPAGGFSTLDNVPKGNGTTLVGSVIYDVGGLVGIGNSGPLHRLDVDGTLFQTNGNSFFNQSLDDSEGNMGIGDLPYLTAKLGVDSDQDYGIYVTNPTGFAAGYFDGYVLVEGDQTVDGNLNVVSDLDVTGFLDVGADLYVAGDLDVVGALSKGSGTFKIDHPLDPQNKILYHSFVESPDMMNVYNGNIVTDGQGEVTVSLPDYFEALNKDFRYQLTVIGTFAQAIVYRKIANNAFVIKTDKPNVEVSWQVTGIRKDPYAEKNRVVPEVAKTGDQIGKYLYPEAYGMSARTGTTAQRKPKQTVKQKPAVQKATVQKTTEKKP